MQNDNFTQLEEWLSVLVSTYEHSPNKALGKTILYYVTRILHHHDITRIPFRQCHYLKMYHYWHAVEAS